MNPDTTKLYSPEEFEAMAEHAPDMADKMMEVEPEEVPEVKKLSYKNRKGFMRNKPCPCGSGKKFKKCHWTQYGEYLKQNREALK